MKINVVVDEAEEVAFGPRCGDPAARLEGETMDQLMRILMKRSRAVLRCSHHLASTCRPIFPTL